MSRGPAAILVNEAGDVVGVVDIGGTKYLQAEVKRLVDALPAGTNILGLIGIDPAQKGGLAEQATLLTRASEATALLSDGRLTTIDAVLDSIKDTDGIKKITDELPAGTKQIGFVAQGTKNAGGTESWPVALYDDLGNALDTVSDVGVQRLQINGKVQVVGAIPPPNTTSVNVFAHLPLVVGSADTVFVIPDGETFYLQQVIAGNEDPTKGASIEVIYDNGTEHLAERVYTNGRTINIGYGDQGAARDGVPMVGNAGGTFVIIIRRIKYSGSNIAIDAIVRGYTV